MTSSNATTTVSARRLPALVGLTTAAAALFAAGCFFVGTQQPVQAELAAQQPTQGGVGVLDFEKLQDQSAYFGSLRTELEELAQSLDGELRAEAARIQEEARQAQENLAPGSDQLLAKQRELGERQALLQFRQQLAQRQSLDAVKEKNLEFFEQVEIAARKVASERGLAVILRKNMRPMPANDEDAARLEAADLEQRIRGQYLVYVNAGADVTDEVVQALDMANEGQ
ncbi:MAG: OmpH family outer membrane protein [Planctomycetota bacterium]